MERRTKEEIERDIQRNRDIGFNAIGDDTLFDRCLEINSELQEELRQLLQKNWKNKNNQNGRKHNLCGWETIFYL